MGGTGEGVHSTAGPAYECRAPSSMEESSAVGVVEVGAEGHWPGTSTVSTSGGPSGTPPLPDQNPCKDLELLH